jgi:hypothetical protein
VKSGSSNDTWGGTNKKSKTFFGKIRRGVLSE